jgi:citrate lyase beta subunit
VADRLAQLRSLLFVAAHREDRLAAGFASEADAVVCDLEDAVPAASKEGARELLPGFLGTAAGRAARAVRINAPETGLAEDDLLALRGLELDAIVLPKATPESVAWMRPDGPPVIAVIETAQGLRQAYEVAAAPRVVALALGAVDLGLDLRLEPRADAQELLYARSKLVVDSVAAGVRPPFDRVFADFDDAEGLEADARMARSLGFGGKSCTHLAQPEVVNRIFGETRPVAPAKDAYYAG